MRTKSPQNIGGPDPAPDPQDLAPIRDDQILEAAIASYSAQPPRPGLELRIMAHARSIEPAPARNTWVARLSLLRRGMLATATIACTLIVAFTFWSLERLPHPHFGGTTAATTSSGPVSSTATAKPPAPRQVDSGSSAASVWPVASGAHRSSAKQRNSIADAPKPDLMPSVFPTPAPLTAEERALVVLAMQGPKEVQHSLTDEATQSGQPITIAAIQVEPLPPLAPSTTGTTLRSTP